MAVVSSDITIKWSILPSGTPNVEFWYPADVPSEYVRLYHGISNNAPNRRIIKTIKMGVSAGGVHNFRDVGYSDELIKLDIVLSTKEEAEEFTSFFTGNVKGMANVFYYRNNLTGQESIVRLMKDDITMGESEGHPYSFTLLMRKETPYSGSSITFKYNIIQTVTNAFVFGGHFGQFSAVMMPTNSRTLHTVGSNSGALGTGDYDDRSRFEQIGVATDWAFGAGGDGHAHVVNDDGDLFSSGSNSYGQLGLGDTSTRNVFTQLGSDTWAKIACGLNFTAAIRSDGTLWAWGQNNSGQLGQGSYDSTDHSSPLQIGIGTDWADVACGAYSLRALKTDGTLWACGRDNYGQLGQGSTATRRTSLVQMGVATDWSFVAGGYEHTLALKTDGALWACGRNDRGELGDGSTVDSYSLKSIGADTWSHIAAGAGGPGSSYGIKTAGTLWSWGMNSNYELGIGSDDDLPHSSPILIDAGTTWVHVHARQTGASAAKSNNEIWTWGQNAFGECGVGGNNFVSTPTRTFLASSGVEFIWDIIVAGPPPLGPLGPIPI